MSDRNTPAVAEATKPQDATKQSKEHEAIEQDYLEGKGVREGYTLRYATANGETRAVIEKKA